MADTSAVPNADAPMFASAPMQLKSEPRLNCDNYMANKDKVGSRLKAAFDAVNKSADKPLKITCATNYFSKCNQSEFCLSPICILSCHRLPTR